jgi:hypothetical protein
MGLALLVLGLVLVDGPAGWAIAAFALLPLVTGAADICPICPLLGDAKRTEAGCTGATCR